jgi:hypothetical protein
VARPRVVVRSSALAFLLAVVALFGGPAAADSGPPVQLVEGLTISTSRSVRVPIDVPADLSFDLTSLSASGPGDFIGVVLERPGDPAAFSAYNLRYPADSSGFAYVSTGITLAEQDAQPAGLLLSPDVTTRQCSTQCRLPAGAYELLVITDEAPITVTVRGDGTSFTELNGSDFAPLATVQHVAEPHTVDWGDQLPTTGAGGSSAQFGEQREALAYRMVETAVNAELAASVTVDACATVDAQCNQSATTHTYIGNRFQGPEGRTSYEHLELPAGDHGLQLTYDYGEVGGGTLVYTQHMLLIYR